jgi:hypothetical protein
LGERGQIIGVKRTQQVKGKTSGQQSTCSLGALCVRGPVRTATLRTKLWGLHGLIEDPLLH